MPMVTVSISPEQAARLRAAVDCGAYASGSEVVREALRLWACNERRMPQATGAHQREETSAGVSVRSLLASHQMNATGGRSL